MIKNIKEIVLIANLTTILIVQQFALSFIPNVQFSTLLIFLYSRVLNTKKTLVIIILYVFGYSLVVNSYNT